MFASLSIRRLAAVAVLSAIVPAASAASLSVTNTLMYNAETSLEIQNGSTTTVTGGTYTYSNWFPSTDTALPSGPGNYDFYDDYVFTIAGSAPLNVSARLQANGILWMSNVQVRFYKLGAFDLPVLGTPPGGEIQGWSAPQRYMDFDAPMWLTVLPAQNLAAGSYVLEVRGNVGGNFGGGYNGDLTVGPAAVPLPGAAVLFVSGMLGLAGTRAAARRKSRR